MNKKKIKILFVFLIICALLLGIIFNIQTIQNIMKEIRIKQYGEPIDESTGLINNQYFDIQPQNSKKATKGINKAIEYAEKNNISYIKLQRDTYLIDSVGLMDEEKGIIIKSNIEFDLNGSKLIIKENSSPYYSAITIQNVNNVILKNGTIVGDKEKHTFVADNDQWGFGISIKDASNIGINNIEIYDTIGDGIYISKIKENPKDIRIFNCNIYKTRRQGISIISGENLKIYNNEIHDIFGKNPQSAINVESNNSNQNINNVEIYYNKLYNLGGTYAIKIQKNIYSADVYNNEINQSILVYDAKEMVTISHNNIKNGSIIVYSNNNFQNEGFVLNKVNISNNTIENGSIELTRVINSCVEQNILNNSYINIIASSCAFANNTFNASSVLSYAYNIDYISYYRNVSEVYLYNNIIEGLYENKEVLCDSYLVKIYQDDYDSYLKYKTEKNFVTD